MTGARGFSAGGGLTAPELDADAAAVVAASAGTPLHGVVIGLLNASVELAQNILCGTREDRDEHIAIGMLMAFRALKDELEGAPMRAEAEAKRQAAAKGTPPNASPYG